MNSRRDEAKLATDELVTLKQACLPDSVRAISNTSALNNHTVACLTQFITALGVKPSFVHNAVRISGLSARRHDFRLVVGRESKALAFLHLLSGHSASSALVKKQGGSTLSMRSG